MTDVPLPVFFKAPDGSTIASLTMGAAEGPQYATLALYKGDIINVRNIQGGTVDNPNFDVGAGSTEHPGQHVVNWDVGQGYGVYNGQKARVFSVNWKGNKQIHSHLPHRFHAGALVPDGRGGWRKLT